MDFSQITPTLFVGTTPVRNDYHSLRALEIGLVINLRVERPPAPDFHYPPMPTLWLPVFDSPLIPIPIHALQRGVQAAISAIAQSRKVYAHCAAGVHRSAALAACILIAQGYAAGQAMDLVKAQRRVADPHIWYIRRQILRFAEAQRG